MLWSVPICTSPVTAAFPPEFGAACWLTYSPTLNTGVGQRWGTYKGPTKSPVYRQHPPIELPPEAPGGRLCATGVSAPEASATLTIDLCFAALVLPV